MDRLDSDKNMIYCVNKAVKAFYRVEILSESICVYVRGAAAVGGLEHRRVCLSQPLHPFVDDLLGIVVSILW